MIAEAGRVREWNGRCRWQKENLRTRTEFGEHPESRRRRTGTRKGYQAGGDPREKKRTEEGKGGIVQELGNQSDVFQHLWGTKHRLRHWGCSGK